jgi:hypothetical protein
MSQSDEVYSGERCAVCEERFKPGEDERPVPGTGERVHVNCWTQE